MERKGERRVCDWGGWEEKGLFMTTCILSQVLWPGSLVERLVGVTLAMIIRERLEGRK